MWLRDTGGSALRADRSHVAQTKEVMLCVHSILLHFTAQPSASTGCSLFSTNSMAWKARFRAIHRTISSEMATTPFASRSQWPASPTADLSIETKENTLTIHGEKQATDEEKRSDLLYKGIAERAFERSFQLADHVVVRSAKLANGLLHIDLVREVPEAMKPRAIPIVSSDKMLDVEPTKLAA